MMEEKKQKAVISEWIKVWLTMSYLIILFYMYAYYTGGKTARQIPIEAHLQHGMTTIFCGVAALFWGLETKVKALRFLFISFAIFRLFALLHRIIAYAYDWVIVTNAPTYSVLAFIALIFAGYDWIRRRDIKDDRASEC